MWDVYILDFTQDRIYPGTPGISKQEATELWENWRDQGSIILLFPAGVDPSRWIASQA